MIKSLLEIVFEKVGRQKINVTVTLQTIQKFGKTARDALTIKMKKSIVR